MLLARGSTIYHSLQYSVCSLQLETVKLCNKDVLVQIVLPRSTVRYKRGSTIYHSLYIVYVVATGNSEIVY